MGLWNRVELSLGQCSAFSGLKFGFSLLVSLYRVGVKLEPIYFSFVEDLTGSLWVALQPSTPSTLRIWAWIASSHFIQTRVGAWSRYECILSHRAAAFADEYLVAWQQITLLNDVEHLAVQDHSFLHPRSEILVSFPSCVGLVELATCSFRQSCKKEEAGLGTMMQRVVDNVLGVAKE